MPLSQLSPGVVIREIDNSTVTTVSNPAYGAVVGAFERGPINEIRVINTEEQLKQVFGKPNDSNFETWFAAAQYILYGGSMKVIRTDSSSLLNAVSNSTAVKIDNLQDYETNYSTGQSWYFAGKTPGTWANGIRVYLTDAGADQVLTLDAPASGNEWQFVVGDPITAAAGGAAGRVYKYSVFVKLTSVVGTPTAGACTIGGDGATVLAYDKASATVEIQFDSDYVGVLVASDTFVQTGVSAVVSTVTRKLLSVTNKGAVDFSVGNDITDDNSNSVNIGAVAKEYLSREVFKGLRWSSVGVRPGTSPAVAAKNGYKDEVHVVVVDTKGIITGTPNTILEKFVGLSKASDAKTPNGEINYLPEVLKVKSNYVYFGDHNDSDVWSFGDNTDTPGDAASNSGYTLYKSSTYDVTDPITGDPVLGLDGSSTIQYVLASGDDEYAWDALEYQASLNLLADPEAEDIDFIIAGAMGSDDLQALAKTNAILNVIESRKDCMTFISPKRSDIIGLSDSATITQNLTNYFSKFPSSSYMAFDSGYKYIYDAYNDVYRYIPCNGDMAGLCLTTARNADAWFSPAGFQRGVLRNAIKLAYSPNKAQRDELYSERVNPGVSFPGQGIVLFGDKTALGYASAFDRINVRRLFLTIEKVIGRSAKSLLFAQNDETSRSQFRNFVEPYLRNIQGRRGVTDFLVKCDTSNNTPETVDRGEFYAEIYIKPTRTINFITISFIATRTGVAFEEVAS
jgi:hypothetical protein